MKRDLLEILACPKCKGPVVLASSGDGIVCRTCELFYPIRDGIPVMLIADALPLPERERE